MTTYGLWRAESPLNLAPFPTEAEALAAVRAAVEQHGSAFVSGWSLVRVPERGDWQTVAEGPQLAERSTTTRTSVGNSSRTMFSCEVVQGKQRVAAKSGRSAAMATGKGAASQAGKELGSKKSSKGEKTVAGSDLAQAKKGSKKGRARGA